MYPLDVFWFNNMNWMKSIMIRIAVVHHHRFSNRRYDFPISYFVFVRLTISLYLSDTENILLSTSNDYLWTDHDDDKYNFLEIISNFQYHSLAGLMIEIRPTLGEESRCALLLVHNDSDLRWIFRLLDL